MPLLRLSDLTRVSVCTLLFWLFLFNRPYMLEYKFSLSAESWVSSLRKRSFCFLADSMALRIYYLCSEYKVLLLYAAVVKLLFTLESEDWTDLSKPT